VDSDCVVADWALPHVLVGAVLLRGYVHGEHKTRGAVPSAMDESVLRKGVEDLDGGLPEEAVHSE
jgi:hypothetical protein